MNKVFLIGNLTKDPEMFTTSEGTPVCKFTIAVNRGFGKDEADFFSVITWRGQAESCCKFLKKGNKAAVVGSIQIRAYEANDGSKKYSTEVIATEVQFLSLKGTEGDVSSVSASSIENAPSDLSADADIPF